MSQLYKHKQNSCNNIPLTEKVAWCVTAVGVYFALKLAPEKVCCCCSGSVL